MVIEDVKNILKLVSFSSGFGVGSTWDVKEVKIYDDGGVILEKGFSIRTTFMRPDINSGEIEKGYGRWMYVPENVSSDGIVKTGWLCVELIVKHELMESFLYENKRIFDPHKSLKDLQYNSRVVNNIQSVNKEEVQLSEGVSEKPISSDKLFHDQNIDNHQSEITNFLNDNFKKCEKTNKSIDKYQVGNSNNNIFHYLDKKGVVLSEGSGKIIEGVSDIKYTLFDVADMLNDFIIKENDKTADPSEVNLMISDAGYINARSQDNFWIFSNPKNKTRYIVHSELEKSIAIVNGNDDIIDVSEKDDYNIMSIQSMFDKHKL